MTMRVSYSLLVVVWWWCRIVKREDGKLEVSFINTETKAESSDTFDTVLFATGRYR